MIYMPPSTHLHTGFCVSFFLQTFRMKICTLFPCTHLNINVTITYLPALDHCKNTWWKSAEILRSLAYIILSLPFLYVLITSEYSAEHYPLTINLLRWKFSLCLIKLTSWRLTAEWSSKLLNLATRWKWLENLKPPAHKSLGQGNPCPLGRSLGGFQISLIMVTKRISLSSENRNPTSW